MGSRKENICLSCNQCSTRQDSIFGALTSDEISQLQNSRSHLTFNYGELIFKEGQRPAGIYIITKGKVKISKFGYEGREQIVRFAKEGDIFGYRAFISDERYSCSATAINETHLCFLSHEFLLHHLKSNPDLGIAFMKLLANDLRTAEEKALHMAQKTVRERIAEAILLLKEIYGFEDDGSTLNINLKRDEIAGMAGTVRETATRFLSEFTTDEIITMNGKKIKILNIAKLIRSANFQ